MVLFCFVDYCVELFVGSKVFVEVILDINIIDKDYLMMSIVVCVFYVVECYYLCVVKLEYVFESDVECILMFVGKGLVYDIGGVDFKVGGFMVGMSCDKGGVVLVVGFMKLVVDFVLKGVKVIVYLVVVCNLIGFDCFVFDEIIISCEGVCVCIGNIDVEGCLVMGDLLSEMKDCVLNEVNLELFIVVILIGYVVCVMGFYSVYVENGLVCVVKILC